MNARERREQTILLAKAKPEVRRRIIERMTWQDVLETDADYERWVNDGQEEPAGDGWRTWLMMAGRGFGKTRAGAEWIFRLANARPGSRIAIVGATIHDARTVMVEGVSGILSVAKAHRRKLLWEPSLGRLKWPNGSEVIQFGDVLALGSGRFRLSRLLRGRGGSEWACAGHAVGEQFTLLKPGTLQAVALPNWSVGATLTATGRDGASAAIEFLGEGLRPPAPINLAADRHESGDLSLSWTRRSRQGFAWIDGVDAPLGETSEQYRINLTGSAGAVELLSTQALVTVPAADVASLGAGSVLIEVRQIGDVAASRQAQLTLTLS